MRRMVMVTDPGAHGKANVGMSNDKGGEIPPRRKTKVSRASQSARGQSGPKSQPNGEGDGIHGEHSVTCPFSDAETEQ